MADKDVRLTASLDASNAIASSERLAKVIGQVATALAGAQTAINQVPTGLGKLTKTQETAVNQYMRLLQVTKQYTSVQQANKQASEAGATGTLRLTSRLKELNKAMAQVEGTSKSEYEARKRTLDLMRQALTVTEKEASIAVQTAAAKQKEASAHAANALAMERENKVALRNQAATEQAATRAAAAAVPAAGVGNLPTARYAMYQVAAAYGAASASALAFGKTALTASADYTSAFAQVARTTGETVDSLSGLNAELQDMDRTIPVAYEDLSNIASLGAQMGIASEGLDEFSDTVAKFAASSNVSIEDASKGFGRLSNLLKIPVEQYNNLGSAVAELGVNSAATESEILNTAQSIAATAHSAGMSTQAVLGLSSAMASLKISPEIARSTLQRVFSELDRAIAENGKELQAWGIQMGMSAEEVKNLYKANPDQFFNDLITSFAKTQDAGGSLTEVFDALGIYSLRTAPTLQRLANSVDLVTGSIDMAEKSYASGTFLNDSVGPVFDTVSSKATMAANSIKNMMASFTAGPAAQAALKGILDLINDAANYISTSVPSAIKTGMLAFVGFIGLWAAYKAMISLAIAAMYAFAQVTQQSLTAQDISLRGLLAASREAFGGQAAAARAATVDIERHTAAVNADAAANERHAATSRADAAASATQGAAAGTGAAGASVKGVLGGAGGFLKSFGAAAGIGLAIGAVTAFASSLYDHIKAADIAAAKNEELKRSFIAAGGGAQSLQEALAKDAADLRAVGGDTSKLQGYAGEIKTSVDDLGNGTAKVTQTLEKLGQAPEVVASKIYPLATSVGTLTTAQGGAETQVGLTTDALKEQSIVLGKNATAWKANAVSQLIDQSDIDPNVSALVINGKSVGTLIGEAISDGSEQGINNVLSQIDGAIQVAKQRAADMRELATGVFNPQGIANALGLSVDDVTGNVSDAAMEGYRTQLEGIAKAADGTVDSLNTFKGIITGNNGALDSAMAKAAVTGDAFKAMGLDIDDAGGDAEETGNKFEGLGDDTETLEQKLQKLASEFSNLLGNMTSIVNNESALAEAFDNLGKSLADHGNDFSLLTEDGRANMSALMNIVSAYGAILTQQIQNGEITAEQGARQMQQYMADLVAQLANMGVPTDKIDFLVGYLNQVVSHNWQVDIGADVTAAMNGINTVADAASQLSGYIAGIGSTYVNTKAYIDQQMGTFKGRLLYPNGLNTTPAMKIPKYGGPTVFGNTGALNNILEQGKANQELANAAKKAGGAGKKAGKDAEDAAKKAADAVKDLADAYKNIGKTAFSLIDSEGKVYESLQKLGQALQENGKQFNTITDSGRKNMSALEDVVDSYVTMISQRFADGSITYDQANKDITQFLSGVYSELKAAGANVGTLGNLFSGLGVNLKSASWKGAGADVKQFSGFIQAASAAAKENKDALKEAADAAKAYGDRLKDAMDLDFSKMYGMQQAVDATTSAWMDLQDKMDGYRDTVKGLQADNEKLNQTIQEQTVAANKALIELNLSKKYGETDRAEKYQSDYDAAQGQINDARNQMSSNNNQIRDIEQYSMALTGNTRYALENRSALIGLQQTMMEQLQTYAEAGHSQQEVAKYAQQLKDEFEKQGEKIGFSKGELDKYTSGFNILINTAKTVPDVKMQVTADTAAALEALNAIPKNMTSRTTAIVEGDKNAKAALDAVAKARTAMISVTNPVPGAAAASAAIDSAARNRTATITVTVNQVAGATVGPGWDKSSAIKTRGGFYARGGLIKGALAGGGLVPGVPPANPATDNLLAKGPDGLYAIRSGEYMQTQEAVNFYGLPFMNAIRDLRYNIRGGYAQGGLFGGTPAAAQQGSTQGNQEWAIVQLSPEDRRLLATVGDRPVYLTVGAQQIAEASAEGGKTNARRGGA